MSAIRRRYPQIRLRTLLIVLTASAPPLLVIRAGHPLSGIVLLYAAIVAPLLYDICQSRFVEQEIGFRSAPPPARSERIR